jgi:glutathione peroxidase
MPTVYDFTATRIDGGEQSLEDFRDQVILVVNTASQCGYTPQYAGLQRLYKKYRKQGFTVLGFPCDQFGHQEPGDENEIANFCSTIYHVTFPMFAKVDVNGSRAHPLFAWLKSQAPGILGGRIKWNFTKFLIGRDGQVIGRFAPNQAPEKLAGRIEAALAVTVEADEAPEQRRGQSA